jgi:hypothetical protein
MPYGVTVGALAIIFIIIELIYIAQRKLLPGIMMLFSFILLVLFIAGIIGTAIQLFGGPNINNQCNQYVFNNNVAGSSLDTLAFLQQRNICKSQRKEGVILMWTWANRHDRSMLASRIRLLDHRLCVSRLDDGNGKSSQLEPVSTVTARIDSTLLLQHSSSIDNDILDF